MWIICETAPLQHFYVAGLGMAMLCLAISTAIVYRALAKVYHDHTILMNPFAGVIAEPVANDRWLYAHNLENSVIPDDAPFFFGNIPLLCFWIAAAGVCVYVCMHVTPPFCFWIAAVGLRAPQIECTVAGLCVCSGLDWTELHWMGGTGRDTTRLDSTRLVSTRLDST